MIDELMDWWRAGLNVLETMPAWLAAFLVGWVISVGLTQPAKFMIPRDWPPDDREELSRLIAFFSAMLPAGVYYANANGTSYAHLWMVMLGAGLWSPIAFALLIAFLRRGGRESLIADVLSGDKRGVIVSTIRRKP